MENNKKIKVLYIDDEQNNLMGFKASFRLDYNVLTAINTADALKILEENPDISVILSDQKMPDQTGVEFFEEIRGKYSAPVRILITGYTDIESVINAINKGHVFRYIKKPWTDVDVKSAIEEAYRFYMTTSMLAVKNQELEKAYTELDKFAYSATHDMRGPILSVLGIISLARESESLDEMHGMIDMMENAMLKLDRYIKDLHDYYNIRRGELNIAKVDFKDIISDIRDLYDITSKVNNVKFEITLDENGDFRSDSISIKIIINNLLSNAFKYQRVDSEEKVVRLKISTDSRQAEIIVDDNGIGIPDSSKEEVFKMFYRGSSTEVGSGFGLYNVKDALNKINGKIEMESKVNEGTEFKVTIPSK